MNTVTAEKLLPTILKKAKRVSLSLPNDLPFEEWEQFGERLNAVSTPSCVDTVTG